MFSQARGGQLLFTEFSRNCAQQWIVHHGRRFACTKKRKDHGRTHTKWRLKGSMLAVRKLQNVAADLLIKAATRDDHDENAKTSRNTILGVTRCKLMRGAVRSEVPLATKQLENFRKNDVGSLGSEGKGQSVGGSSRRCSSKARKPSKRIRSGGGAKVGP
jgi:hypothetical protein